MKNLIFAAAVAAALLAGVIYGAIVLNTQGQATSAKWTQQIQAADAADAAAAAKKAAQDAYFARIQALADKR